MKKKLYILVILVLVLSNINIFGVLAADNDYISAYSNILEQYVNVYYITKSEDNNKAIKAIEKYPQVNDIFSRSEGSEGVYYSLIDLDNNSVPELIVSSKIKVSEGVGYISCKNKYEIMQIFTYYNGKLIDVLGTHESLGYRAHCKISRDKTMFVYGDFGAECYGASLYKLVNDKVYPCNRIEKEYDVYTHNGLTIDFETYSSLMGDYLTNLYSVDWKPAKEFKNNYNYDGSRLTATDEDIVQLEYELNNGDKQFIYYDYDEYTFNNIIQQLAVSLAENNKIDLTMYETDPFNILSYCHILDSEYIDNILINDYNIVPDHNWNDSFGYYYNGKYYFVIEGSGPMDIKETYNVSEYVQLDDKRYFLKIGVNSVNNAAGYVPDISYTEFGVYAELKDIGGKREWTFYQIG